jgi:hypothetical protein
MFLRAFVLTALVLLARADDDGPVEMSLDGGAMKVSARLPSATTIEFTIKADKANYVSIGFGSDTMTNADVVSVENTATTPTVHDRWSTSHATPVADTGTNEWTMTSSVTGSTATYVLTRVLDTGNTSEDYKIPLDTEFKMIWCYGPGAFADHGPRYGNFIVTAYSANKQVILGSKGGLDNYEIHGLGTYIAWSCLSFILIVTGRWFKSFPRGRIVIHAIVGILIMVMSIVFTGYADGAADKPIQNKLAHEGMAGISNTFAGIAVGSGFAIRIFMFILSLIPCTNSPTWRIVWITRLFHIWWSYFTIIWANYGIVSGLWSYDSRFKNLIWI